MVSQINDFLVNLLNMFPFYSDLLFATFGFKLILPMGIRPELTISSQKKVRLLGGGEGLMSDVRRRFGYLPC